MFKPKPIETKYAGYRFRSRLEARWAVFFDALGIDWEYEPEGYELGSAGRYLPDFRIDHRWFIEIKPLIYKPDVMVPRVQWRNVDYDVAAKCDALARGLETTVMLICGEPKYIQDMQPADDYVDHDYDIGGPEYFGVQYVGRWFDLPFDGEESFANYLELTVYELGEHHDVSWFDGSFSSIIRLLDLEREDYRQRPRFLDHNIGPCGVCFAEKCLGLGYDKLKICSNWNVEYFADVYAASKVAMHARFEHGETPQIQALPKPRTSNEPPF